ncbi:MAG: hypothetical protein WC076_06265 [Terrimicrobiaceae bacterium]|jgi:hypothetical protein|nr:hypothetical protein [Terrimicrobiaceae bacterium]
MLMAIRHRVLIGVLRPGVVFSLALGALCGVQAQQPSSVPASPSAPGFRQIGKTPERWPETISV